MITFFHTADIHFGVENYGKVDPKTGIHTRLLDFKESLSKCIDHAIQKKADFFLFSGDAYKTAHPTPTQQKLLMEEFLKLQQADIPVVIVVGNHDHPLSFGKANALDVFAHIPLGGLHVFSKPDLITLETKSGPVQILGVPWPTRNNLMAKEEHRKKRSDEITTYLSARVNEIVRHFTEKLDPNIPAVLAGHLTVSNGIFSGSEKRAVFGTDPLFLPSELALPQFDYVALGHLHRYQNLNANGYPAVVYSGSIDRVDFGERKEGKGYCKVRIETGVKPGTAMNQFETLGTHEFIPLKTRPFIQVELELQAGIDQTDQVIKELEKHDITDAIVKIVYHVGETIQDNVDLLAIQRACSSAMYLVGVFPKRTQVKRAARVDVNVDMGFNALLRAYIEAKPECADRKDVLIKKAQLLYDEVQSQNSE